MKVGTYEILLKKIEDPHIDEVFEIYDNDSEKIM